MTVSMKVVQYAEYMYVGFVVAGRVFGANIMFFTGYSDGKRPLVSYNDALGRKRHIWGGREAFGKVVARNYKRALQASCK
jgi:hypothetical protein